MRDKNIRLAVALDGLHKKDMLSLAEVLAGHVDFFKVTDALDRYGSSVVRWLQLYGEVFADPKLEDIPRTVANRVQVYCEAGASLVTVHALYQDALEAAAEVAAKSPHTHIVAVTELTSNKNTATKGTVILKAEGAVRANIRSITCPSSILPWIRRDRVAAVKSLHCVTPGVRPLYAPDPRGQKDFATPTDILRAAEGRNVTLVVGTPVLQSHNYGMSPLEMVTRIRQEMAEALSKMAA